MGYFITSPKSNVSKFIATKTETFIKFASRVDLNASSLPDSGIPLNVKDKTAYISNSESHCLVCGASGKGKTRRVLYPLVTMSARAERSMVIADIKGEIYRNTASEVKKRGLKVKVINLRNPSTGNRYNPFSLIQDYWRLGNQSRATILLKDIVNLLTSDIKSEKDKYWEMAAKDVLIGIALFLLEKDAPLSFSSMNETFNRMVQFLKNKDDSDWEDSLVERAFEREVENLRSKTTNAGKRLSSWLSLTSETTRSCIDSEVGCVLSKYDDQEDLRDLLSGSDITMTDLGKKPTAIYFICPDESSALYDIASLFVEQCYSELINFADTREENRLDVKVDFILDEFGSFIGCDWPSKLTAARSRGIRFILALQNISQLSARYGSNNANTIQTNCRTLLFMGGRDLELINLMSAYAEDDRNKFTQTLMRLEMGDVAILDDAGTTFFGYLPDWEQWGVTERATLSGTKRKKAKPQESEYIKIGIKESEIDLFDVPF